MRKDGRKLKTLDPFFKIMPFFMKTRVGSANSATYDVDLFAIEPFIKKQKAAGNNFSYMSVFIAAYLRTVASNPFMNRFVVNKKIYARKGFSVAFVLLRPNAEGVLIDETTIKVELNLTDTLPQVAKKLADTIEENRKPATKNMVDKIVTSIMNVPLLPKTIVNFLLLLEKHGLLPKVILDASPFHTGLFITNLASISLGSVNHHLFEFGTASVLIAIGKRKKVLDDDGKTLKNVLPLGFVADDRIGGGILWANARRDFTRYIKYPELLLEPLDTVIEDIK